MFKMLKNILMPFLAGIFFTMFILLVIFVIYLYNENTNLRRDIDNFQKKLSNLEIKISTQNDFLPEAQSQSQVTADSETKTYYVPKEVETVPYTNPVSGQTIKSNNTNNGDGTKSSEYSGKQTYTIPNKVESSTNPSNISSETTISSSNEEFDGTTKTYYVPNQVPTKPIVSSGTQEINTNIGIDSDVTSQTPVYVTSSWDKLKNNMSKSEVVNLLGKPNKILSRIESTSFVYQYREGDGIIYFNRSMKVSSWKRPI